MQVNGATVRLPVKKTGRCAFFNQEQRDYGLLLYVSICLCIRAAGKPPATVATLTC